MKKMSRKPETYALLAAVGKYDPSTELVDLSCAQNDLDTMSHALERGLKIDSENIRKLGGDGTVTTLSFARSIAEFNSLLREEDTFLFYFSGHGRGHELMFSDAGITIKSIVDYVDKLPARQKVVILDCCYSGQTTVGSVRAFSFEEATADFAETGIAVLASSAQDSRARLTENGYCSVYTEVVSYALTARRNIREGKLSLASIAEEIRYLMDRWNQTHPGKEQKPIFRENIVGTIYFPVEEYHPYVPQKVFFETEEYIVHHVKPLSTGSLKRLAAFVILKKEDDSIIPDVTKQIVSQLLYSEVYASKQSEMRFHGRPADVIWCYFGHDEADIVRSNHFAYTIWSGDVRLRETYYRENRNAEVVDDIYVFWNTSYQIVKDLQESKSSEKESIAEYQKLANMLIAHAELFIKDLEEIENGTLSFLTVKTAYQEWINEVRHLFFKLTGADPAPIGLHEWTEAVLDLAGWIVDMAIALENMKTAGEDWMINQSIDRYQKAIDTLCGMEQGGTRDAE